MHPAPSVIVFTTLSGLGFGLLFFLGLGVPSVTGWVAFVFYGLAYALAVGGLLASTFHLGRPERAWKAFSQWRSSWLSREGCFAVAALLVMALHGAGVVFLARHWWLLGGFGAALCALTVLSTAMIYAQLKTVPRWHCGLTILKFLGLSLAGGALLAGQSRMAIWFLILAGLIMLSYWARGSTALTRAGHSVATATGLGGFGKVRAFEPPHTGSNYLLHEMAFHVGRKHRKQLRVLGFLLGFVLPVLFLLMPGENIAFKHLLAGLAVLLHLAGVLCCRWLFFAEAEHVVGLYYGRHQNKMARG